MTGSDSAAEGGGARRVLLARYRSGMARQAAHPVHLIPLPVGGKAGAVSALCGTLLGAAELETVTPGQGAPCTLCFLAHLTSSRASSTPPATTPIDTTSPLAAAAGYRALGWRVTVRRTQVLLTLTSPIIALIIPTPLATEVSALLAVRRCPAPTLIHPLTPHHRILLTSEPYGIPLPWPDEVHTATGHLPLPPTRTTAGPVTWTQLPYHHIPGRCREIDVFGALRTIAQRH